MKRSLLRSASFATLPFLMFLVRNWVAHRALYPQQVVAIFVMWGVLTAGFWWMGIPAVAGASTEAEDESAKESAVEAGTTPDGLSARQTGDG